MRLYILIDESLDAIYGCVQGAHCVAEFMLNNKSWNNDYLIFLKADINKIVRKLELKGIEYIGFKEPDLDNKLTAIAVLENGSLFKRLKLMGT